MRAVVTLALLLALASCLGEPRPSVPGRFVFPDEGRVVDLGVFDAGAQAEQASGPGSAATTLWADRLPEPGQCVRPLVVIDQREEALADTATLLGMPEIEAWERRHGAVPFGAWVALRSGWSARRPRTEAYQGGEEAEALPSIQRATLAMLRRERGIAGLLVETPRLGGEPEAVWAADLQEIGCSVVLGCVGLQELPATGSVVVLAPFPSDSGRYPIRLFAITARAVRATPRW